MGNEPSKPKKSNKGNNKKIKKIKKKQNGNINNNGNISNDNNNDNLYEKNDDNDDDLNGQSNGASNGSTKKKVKGNVNGTDAVIDEDGEMDDFGFGMSKKLTINDFTFLKVVGKGSFGKVMQVRKNDNGKVYALKVLKKKELVKRRQVVHTQTERRVLANIDNPFIVSLRYAFQSAAKLYMVLDFFNGGELFC